jgi:hypothetical protein
VKPLFLSQQAEDGFASLRDDLAKLRQKNREVIPERHLRLLDKTMGLITVIGTVILSVAIIYMVWAILSSSGMDAITKMTQWCIDLLKLLGV